MSFWTPTSELGVRYELPDTTLVCPPGSMPDPGGVGCHPVNVDGSMGVYNPLTHYTSIRESGTTIYRPGMQGLGGGCSCGGMRKAGDGDLSGLGEPLLCSSTGYALADVGIGAVVGYFLAPKKEDRAAWAAAGGGAGFIGGVLGIAAVAAAAIYVRSK